MAASNKSLPPDLPSRNLKPEITNQKTVQVSGMSDKLSRYGINYAWLFTLQPLARAFIRGRERVLKEIIETEAKYVETLRKLLEVRHGDSCGGCVA